jgi:predicted kinase
MITKKILILRGLQASGKSTYAREWISKDPESRVRFNRDDIRNMLGKYWVPSREDIITDMYKGFLESAMGRGYDIVIDNMNLNENTIKEIETVVNDFNDWAKGSNLQYEIEIKDFFSVPLQTCIERDSKRENPIGANVIKNTYMKYKDKIVPWKYLD